MAVVAKEAVTSAMVATGTGLEEVDLEAVDLVAVDLETVDLAAVVRTVALRVALRVAAA